MSRIPKPLGLQAPERTHVGVSNEILVPRCCTPEGFAEEASNCGGVGTAKLGPLTRLRVQTHNTLYELTLIDPQESLVMVQGGRYFSEPSRAHLCGSSYGGTLIKLCWIGLGMRMELLRNRNRIITSPVVSVDILDDLDLPGPF